MALTSHPGPFGLLLFLLHLFALGAASSPLAHVHLPLRQIIASTAASDTAANTAGSDAFEKLARLATASLLRARRLKDHKRGAGSPSSVIPIPFSRVPLFPHSYGGYSLSLGFGTPPQQIPLVLDTASELVWVPCTKSYVCSNCSPSGPDSNATAPAPVFIPRSSSSARLVGCRNPKCTWIHSPEFLSRCRNCPLNASVADCSPLCPPYTLLYGSGSTGGLLLSETLQISPEGAAIPNFAVATIQDKFQAQFQAREWRERQIRKITDKAFDKFKNDAGKDHLSFEDVYIAVLYVYNDINKHLPGPHTDPPSKEKLKAMIEEYDMNLDGLLDREEFAEFIRKLTADTLTLVSRNLIIAFVVAPTLALITKRSTERVPGVGRVVQRIPNSIYASVVTLAVVLLQNSTEDF